LSPIAVSLLAFPVILGRAFAGTLLRKALPDRHLAEDAKDIIRLGTGLIGTIAALVLGLLIASAKSSYEDGRAKNSRRSKVTNLPPGTGFLPPETERTERALETLSACRHGKAPRNNRQIWPQKPPTCLQFLISRFRRTGWWRQ